ncbi:MAG: response regulator [Desulfomonilaceae bacterium]
MNSPTKVVGDVQTRINRFILLIAAFWTIVILAVAGLQYRAAYSSAMATARAGLFHSYNKELVFRSWSARHGGVYVTVTPDTPPNPYLANIPERDIITPSGKQLTLMNGAYMTRQVQELGEKKFGHKVHTTSLKPLRPENAPDEWEREVLLDFERGKKEAFSLAPIGNETYLRLMLPHVVEPDCLKCHINQGYKVGDIIGGISTSTPWKPVEKTLFAQIRNETIAYGGIWLLGILGLALGRSSIKHQFSERKEAEVRLHSAFKLQAQFLDTAATAIFTIDTARIITGVNDELLRITGFDKEDVVGKPCDFILGEPCDRVCPLFGPDSRERMFRQQCTLKTRDGNQRIILKNSSITKNDSGIAVGCVESFVDITDLIEARSSAEKASLAKSQFLANMSHQIRTPLNGVIGMVDLSLGTELNEEQREYMETAKISADSLLTLINDILDFSKIEAGKLELVPIDFSLRDCIANTLTTLAVIAHKKGLELIYEIPAEVPDYVTGDPGRLRQILVNLVGNAIKFTETGEVSVRTQLESETDSEICLQFTITDTGIGIPVHKQEKIFDSFEQADGSTTREYGGTGLGLAVSTQLIRMMGGTIWVQSDVGRGSVFRFTVNLGLQAQPSGMFISFESSSLMDVPVLVVDDNATNRRVLTQMLASWNMKPVSVDGAGAALVEMKLAYDRGTPYPVVLIDYMMPDTDGFELAAQIKGDPNLKESILIMLTSAGERGHAARCVELGIAAYLMKPVRQSELFDIVCSSLHETGSGKTSASLLTRHAIRESKRRLKVLLAEDNPVNQKLATRLLEKMGHSVTVVENGRLALAAFLKDQFDVILMDIQMPEMDGFEALAAIRKIEKSQDGKHIHVIAMTAHAMAGDRERCLEGGMDGYISKPINVKELVEAMENLPPNNQMIS